MSKIFTYWLAVSLLLLPACQQLSSSPGNKPLVDTAGKKSESAEWVCLTKHAAFPEKYNFQLLSMRDSLWALHPDGAWFSTDGSSWAKSSLEPAIGNYAFLDYVWFHNSLYGLGHLTGNIERHDWSPVIYQSTNLRNWTVLSQESNLPRRYFYHPFVFQDKIWIIGGEDETRKYSDVWTSADAVHWEKRADNLPFGPRSGSQVVVFKGRLILLDDDVWSSEDGLHWQQETKAIIKGESIFGYAAVIFENHIWLLGCNRNGVFSSEVLTSADGKDWRASRAPWSPRGGMAACTFRNALYATGGKYGGTPDHTEFVYSNDVWQLSGQN